MGTMKKTTAVGLVLAMTLLAGGSTGCLGRSAMGKSVLKWNLQVSENKWVRWGVFVLLGPVYGFAGAADLMVINSIEFHTGTNPWSNESRLAKAGQTHVEQGPGGERVVSTLRADGSIDLVITEANSTVTEANVFVSEGEFVARDADGRVLARVRDPRQAPPAPR